jgi:hypothetical protein
MLGRISSAGTILFSATTHIPTQKPLTTDFIMKKDKAKAQQVYLVASGDLRLSANQVCWPAQSAMEDALAAAFKAEGFEVVRAHPYDPELKHGFISSQKQGLEVFRTPITFSRDSQHTAAQFSLLPTGAASGPV